MSTEVTGRALDALVAEQVMGWERWTCADYDHQQAVLVAPMEHAVEFLESWVRVGPDIPLERFGAAGVPRYSTEIAAAWEVVEHLKAQGHVVIVKADGKRPIRDDNPQYTVLIDYLPRVDAPTAAEAICRAALKTVTQEGA